MLCVFPGRWGRPGRRLFSLQDGGLHRPPMRLPALPSVRPPVCPLIQPCFRMFMELPLCSGCCPRTLLTARPSQALLWGTDQRNTDPAPVCSYPKTCVGDKACRMLCALGETAQSPRSETWVRILSPSPISNGSQPPSALVTSSVKWGDGVSNTSRAGERGVVRMRSVVAVTQLCRALHPRLSQSSGCYQTLSADRAV